MKKVKTNIYTMIQLVYMGAGRSAWKIAFSNEESRGFKSHLVHYYSHIEREKKKCGGHKMEIEFESLVGLTSIIIAVIAVVMSVFFWTYSAKSMNKSDATLDLIRRISHSFDTQISENFRKLVDGALSALPQGRILRCYISSDALASTNVHFTIVLKADRQTAPFEANR